METKSQLEKIGTALSKELANEDAKRALLATTFKGFDATLMKQAIFEGMVRGFSFKDFLEKNIYAVPFGRGYYLVTSIDYARKIAMRSGLAGKSEPKYVEKDGKIESCTVTVKRNVKGVIGEYTATVYFNEYTTGKNLWLTKPHTMIAKVAEMHALRSAFPEEMAKNYVAEEMEQEVSGGIQNEEWREELDAIDNLEDLKDFYELNKGQGASFDKAVMEKKRELGEKK